MKKTRILCAAVACAMIISVFGGCAKKEDDAPDNVVPNVITSADGAGTAGNGSADGNGGNSGGAVTTTEGVNNAVNEGMLGDDDDNGGADEGGNGGGDALESGGAAEPAVTLETEPVVTHTSPKETLSEDDIMAAVTAKVTEATTVMKTNVDSTSKYAYNSLSKDEQALYDIILESATTLSSKIRVTDAVTLEVWTKIFGMVYNQEPQLFWLNKKINVGRIYFNETDPDKIKSMQKEIDATVDKLLKEASGKSTFDQLRIFHDHLVLNSTFQKTDTLGAYNESIYNAFKGGTSKQGSIQCAGYAKAMLYLCDKAGIDCMVIAGTNESGASHAWNKVKVDGEWYNLDCTWDDPILSTPEFKYLRYNNFLVPDSWINNKTHYNINTKIFSDGSKLVYFDPPKATATAQNYFIKNNLVYKDFDSAEKAIKKAIEDTASSGGSVAEIMVGSQDVYDKLKARMKDYHNDIKSKNSKVRGLADNSNEHMLIIQLDVKYK